MAVTYLMQAKQNYDAAGVALLLADSATPSANQQFPTSKIDVGECYDPVSRKIYYASAYVGDSTTTKVNATGHILWDGATQIAAGASYEEHRYKNASICAKDIDTGAVTFHACFNAANLVPAGIGGGDGTWRRYTNIIGDDSQGPFLVDPRTQNFWMHVYGTGDLSCGLYMFRPDDAYSQIISPLTGAAGHLIMFGLNDDWMFVWINGNDPMDTGLLLVPREITAEETAQDYLLSYASFAAPVDFYNDTFFRTALAVDGTLWVFESGVADKAFALYKFTQPASAPWGGPIVGGGWTDETPWAPGAGPASRVTWNRNGTVSGIASSSKNILWQLPATNGLVCISQLRPPDHTASSTDPGLCFFDCTYVDLDDMSYDYQPGFMQGWMTAAWGLGTDASDSAYVLKFVQEVDTNRAFHSYVFDGSYVDRYFFATVQRVEAGVFDPASAYYIVILKYRFISGSPPVLLQFWDEALWVDYTYAANPMKLVVSHNGTDTQVEGGFYDPDTDAFWWSGDTASMYQLDTAYAYRQSLVNIHNPNPPFLRIAFGASPPLGARRKGSVALQYRRVAA